MRLINKYKTYAHYGASAKRLPLRVLKFKKPKWFKIGKKLIYRTGLNFPKHWIFNKKLIKTKKNRKKKFNLQLFAFSVWRRKISQKRKILYRKKVVKWYWPKPRFFWKRKKVPAVLWQNLRLNFIDKLAKSRKNIRSWFFKKLHRKRKRIKYLIKRINFLNSRVKKKFKLKKIFRKKLTDRKYLGSLYNNDYIKPHRLRKKKPTSKLGLKALILVKPMYRIDHLLWYLDVFVSSSAAKQAINSGYITVNSKIIKLNYFVKAGDIICVNKPLKINWGHRKVKEKRGRKKNEAPVEIITQLKKNIKMFPIKKGTRFWYFNIKKAYALTENLIPFVERDYFTNSFVITKNWEDLGEKDLALIFPGRWNNFSCKLFKRGVI